MKLRRLYLIAAAGLCLPFSLLFANQEWHVSCKKGCESCKDAGDSRCTPESTTPYNVSQSFSAEPHEVNGAPSEDETQCEIPQTNSAADPTAGSGPGITDNNYNRNALSFGNVSPSQVKSEMNAGGNASPRQIRASKTIVDYSDVLPSPIDGTGKGFAVTQYWKDQMPAAGANGIVTIPSNAQPLSKTVYRNPDATANGRLDVIHSFRHSTDGTMVSTSLRLTSPVGNNTWKREHFMGDLAANPGLQPYRVIDVTRTPGANNTETVREITKDKASDGTMVITSDVTTTYAFYKFDEPVALSRTENSGTGAANDITVTYTYYTNSSDPISFNKPATMRSSVGKWANYTYSGSNTTGIKQAKTVSGWLDNAAPAVGTAPDENANRVVIEIEAKHETGTFGYEEKVQGVTIRKTWGERYKDNDQRLVEKTREETGTATLVSMRTGYPKDESVPEIARGRLQSIQLSDGTFRLFSYRAEGTNRVETVDEGAGSLTAITDGKRTISTYTSRDQLVEQITKDIASDLTLSTKQSIGFDENGIPNKWAFDSNLDDYTLTQKGCCGIDSSRSRDGIVTTYTYDALKRRKTSVSQGVTTTYTYGQTTINGVDFPSVKMVKTAGTLKQDLGTTVSDYTGATIASISPDLDGDGLPETTTTINQRNARTTITTNPDGGTVVSVNYADGQRKSTTGTATTPQFVAYSTHNLQGGGLVTINYAGSDNTVLQWSKSFANLAGATFRTTAPNETGAEIVASSITYDSANRPVSSVDADGATSFRAYNAKGEVYRAALDLNGNGQLDLASDRVADTLIDYVLTSPLPGNTPAQRQRNITYLNGTTPITTSTSYTSLDSLVGVQVTLGVANSSVSQAAALTDHADGAWTDTVTAPEGTKTTTTYANWLPVTQSKLSTTNAVIESVTTDYDALLRPTTSAHSRTAAAGVTTTAYHAVNGLVVSSTDPGNRTTSFGYDSSGRRVKATLPDTSISYTSYHPTGSVKASWGSQTYPTWKEYDPQGRMVKLHTWQTNPSIDPANVPANAPAGSAATTWVYDDHTGRLKRKEYADTKGTDYTYTSGGRLHTRVWARGITTTYGYDPVGQLTTVDYSDATPDVTNTYDRLGRQQSITNTVATSTYSYDPANLALDTETIAYDLNTDGTPELTRVLDRSHDTLGRNTGWALEKWAKLRARQYLHLRRDNRAFWHCQRWHQHLHLWLHPK